MISLCEANVVVRPVGLFGESRMNVEGARRLARTHKSLSMRTEQHPQPGAAH